MTHEKNRSLRYLFIYSHYKCLCPELGPWKISRVGLYWKKEKKKKKKLVAILFLLIFTLQTLNKDTIIVFCRLMLVLMAAVGVDPERWRICATWRWENQLLSSCLSCELGPGVRHCGFRHEDFICGANRKRSRRYKEFARSWMMF